MNDLVDFVQKRLEAVADPVKAPQMAAYLKTDMPFYGVQKPARTPIFQEMVATFPPANRAEYEAAVKALWALPHREEKYLAIGLAAAHSQFVTLTSIPLYRKLIVEGGWWDLVDTVATSLVGTVLRRQRSGMTPKLQRWVDDRNMWIRRTAIIAQLGHKTDTDVALLFDFCLRRADEDEFFIRKAIGWALREYAKTDPEAVREFLRANQERLSPLSYREAAKHL